MKTLVTGANGHLGANLVRQLLAEGREVKALVRPNADLRGLKGLDVEIVRGDVLKGDSVYRALEGCSSLFHTATVYRFWHPKPDIIHNTAITGTKNVLSAAQLYGKLDKIVYTSSIAAIGFTRSADQVKTEIDFNADKISTYNEAKTYSEKIAQSLAIRLDLPLVVVNPATILGPNDYKPTPSGQLVLQFIKRGAPVYWEGGMNLVDVEDVAKGHLLAEKKGNIHDRYILGGDNVTVRQIYKTLGELTGKKGAKRKLSHFGAVSIGILMETAAKLTKKEPIFTKELGQNLVGKYAFFDLSKAKRELGYEPKPHRVVLSKALKWFMESDFVPNKLKKNIHPVYQEELDRHYNEFATV